MRLIAWCRRAVWWLLSDDLSDQEAYLRLVALLAGLTRPVVRHPGAPDRMRTVWPRYVQAFVQYRLQDTREDGSAVLSLRRGRKPRLRRPTPVLVLPRKEA